MYPLTVETSVTIQEVSALEENNIPSGEFITQVAGETDEVENLSEDGVKTWRNFASGWDRLNYPKDGDRVNINRGPGKDPLEGDIINAGKPYRGADGYLRQTFDVDTDGDEDPEAKFTIIQLDPDDQGRNRVGIKIDWY